MLRKVETSQISPCGSHKINVFLLLLFFSCLCTAPNHSSTQAAAINMKLRKKEHLENTAGFSLDGKCHLSSGRAALSKGPASVAVDSFRSCHSPAGLLITGCLKDYDNACRSPPPGVECSMQIYADM